MDHGSVMFMEQSAMVMLTLMGLLHPSPEKNSTEYFNFVFDG
jgi:hypothetical protein